ncbi:MAG: cytochrome c oxidase subunit 3 [Solirubrobacteraceae bacterium]
MTDASTGLPHGTSATGPASAAAVAARRGAEPNGWWGMALFLCAEVTLIGTLIGSYFYLDFGSARWPPPGIEAPKITIPCISTGVLLALTPLLWGAARSAKRGMRNRAILLIAIAWVVQMAYLGLQIKLLGDDLQKFLPNGHSGTAYGSIYYTLLVADHGHVLLGILLDAVVLYKLIVRGLNSYWLIGVRGLALYWYVVNFLVAAILVTSLSPSI